MAKHKKTVVLGASTKESRASNQVVHRLTRYGYEAVPLSIKKGEIGGIPIINDFPAVEGVHTVSLYLNPQRQKQYYPYILNELQPERIIFNPGTENEELAKLAVDKGIETENACTLVLLSVGVY